MRLVNIISAIAMIAALSGCGGARPYVNPEADFGFYNRVGVMSFSNLTSDRFAAEKVTNSFLTELLIADVVDVASLGDFDSLSMIVLAGEKVNLIDELTSQEVVALCQAANVTGLFIGSVNDYAMVRSGQEEFPLVSIAVQFIDGQSGRVVWSYTSTKRGGPKFPVFSFGETHTLGDMTRKVVRHAARSFARAAK